MKTCKECNGKLKFGEGWVDYNGERRHAEYLLCENCRSIYTTDGEVVANKEQFKNFKLTDNQ